MNEQNEQTESSYAISSPPKVVGYWCLYEKLPSFNLAMYEKPSDEHIKNTTALLGWVWKDA